MSSFSDWLDDIKEGSKIGWENGKAMRGHGVSFSSLLGLLFIGLKLTNHITWSWWLVTGPFWMPLAAVLGFIVVVFVLALVFLSISFLFNRFRK